MSIARIVDRVNRNRSKLLQESEVASTIQHQIGRRTFFAAGASDFIAGKDRLIFRVRVDKDGFMGAARGRYIVTIILDSNDLYTVTFTKVRGTKIKNLKTVSGIDAESLSDLVLDISYGRWGS